ncbi:MAG: hypothetical protein RSA29_16955 [Clostridium sp.]|uniref:hypothetical protein n=1 Tax=Clostridium sp. TaxID=1506 RepID=UPI00305B3198
MVLKFLDELKQNVTKDEFKEVLAIATQAIIFNNIGFKKLTKEKEIIDVCNKSLLLLRKMN